MVAADEHSDHVSESQPTPDDPRESLWVKAYIPAIAMGLANTLRRIIFSDRFTIEYDGTGDKSDAKKHHQTREGYRGEHYLKRDERGEVKCVACFMCAAACPALCIHIESEDAPDDWPDRDKRPKRFEIDLLRCIYCGYCEEACPVDAIALSKTYNIVSTTREQKIYDMQKLLELGDREAQGKSIGPAEGDHRGPRPTMRGLGVTDSAPVGD